MADLKEIQDKIKTFSTKREQIIRDIGGEESKLEDAYKNLRDLGIENPESLTDEDLTSLMQKTQQELTEKVTLLEQQISVGEELIIKYNNL